MYVEFIKDHVTGFAQGNTAKLQESIAKDLIKEKFCKKTDEKSHLKNVEERKEAIAIDNAEKAEARKEALIPKEEVKDEEIDENDNETIIVGDTVEFDLDGEPQEGVVMTIEDNIAEVQVEGLEGNPVVGLEDLKKKVAE